MLGELVRRGAAEAPERAVVESPERTLTYAACLTRAAALAAGLRERRVERFACVVDDAGELVALLCAASAAGSEACVYPRHLEPDGVADFAAGFGHGVVVTDRDRLRAGPAEVVVLPDLIAPAAELPPPPERTPVLILTTGTTGRPKGARHDWRRLVAAAERGAERGPARWLLAYDLNQFGGVQMLLHVLAAGATLVVPGSRRPADAVAALRDRGVTHASGTPTFWRLVAGRLDRDVARALPVRQVTLGGEAVPGALLERLKELFPAARLSQIYGANEFGTAVSVRDGRPGLPLSVLDRPDDADVQLRVVDGALEARSRVGMLGYHGDDDAGDGWRPTGDLVEIRGDRIHFVGRASEIVNVGGVKVHPLPVEEVVSAVPGVELVRAYGRPNPVAGQVVAVEVVPRDGVDLDALDRDIRAACEALPRAARPRSVRFVAELEIRGAKVVRAGQEA